MTHLYFVLLKLPVGFKRFSTWNPIYEELAHVLQRIKFGIMSQSHVPPAILVTFETTKTVQLFASLELLIIFEFVVWFNLDINFTDVL